MTDAAPAGSIVPRITTERLLLRELRASDLDAYAAFVADPESTKFIGGPGSRRDAWRVLGSLTGAWILTGAGWWGVELRAGGELVGVVGAFFRETMLPLTPDSALELGWNVFRPHWRRGYAAEAARAALAWGFERHPVRRVIAHLDAANLASAGVAQKIGMRYDGEVDFYGEPSSRYVIDR